MFGARLFFNMKLSATKNCRFVSCNFLTELSFYRSS